MLYSEIPMMTERMIVTSAGGLNGANYPLGVNKRQFFDLFYNTPKIDISITSGITILREVTVGLTSILVPELDISTVFDSVKRRIRFVGQYNEDGSELRNSQKPTVCVDYPTFSAGQGGGSVIINFGKTLYFGGLFYPEISVEMSNGITSQEIGNIVGYIDFGEYGSIPMYLGGGNLDGFVFGSVAFPEKYSDSQILNGSIISIDGENSYLNDVDKVLLENVECAFSKNNLGNGFYSLSLAIPENKKGRLVFETNQPYNIWRSSFTV